MAGTDISVYGKIRPMMYAYSTPGVTYHDGWLKIGYTEKKTVKERIDEQTRTAGLRWELAWDDDAMFRDGSGEFFTDRDFHRYLRAYHKVPREPRSEWFKIDPETSLELLDRFERRDYERISEGSEYDLRDEQRRAVEMTRDYFGRGGEEFLWNAKPRFGKTLTAYDLVRQCGFKRVLIVTNRPSIANSWADDFNMFVGWRGEHVFISDTDALSGKEGVISRDRYTQMLVDGKISLDTGIIAFESLQGIKGSIYFGGDYKKLDWIEKTDFDLLIVDESQEGVDTHRTKRAFERIKRAHTLYLSGTPFKQLASDQFSSEQIFNWTYADEQDAKDKWSGDGQNPYERLPRLAMFTYQLSPMIREKVERGYQISDEDTVEYAFDLNEFFSTDESGRFVHEDEVKKFLKALSTQEKYPFSTPELRMELRHTLWLLNRKASVKALAKLLGDPEFGFGDYKVVLAIGSGRQEIEDTEELAFDENAIQAERAFDRVREAIANNDKTITLSVGQLTVGVTIPEWSGVLMLCNLKSPSSYMQAAFRAQNPYSVTRDGQRYRKETAYVFDFDPARTLIIFDEFANNLSTVTAGGRGTGEDRSENIRRLLNFFPVIGEDEEGRMVELDAAQVLSIPHKLKSQEVVRRGFICNFLFKNISNIFGAPSLVRAIVEQLPTAQEEKQKPNQKALDDMQEVEVDDDGDVTVPSEIVIGNAREIFGEKIYGLEAVANEGLDALARALDTQSAEHGIDNLRDNLKAGIRDDVITPASEAYGTKKSAQNQIDNQISRELDRVFDKIKEDFGTDMRIADVRFAEQSDSAETEQDRRMAEEEHKAALEAALEKMRSAAEEAAKQAAQNAPIDVVEQFERNKAEQKMRSAEDEVRAHLRGFARTIPSFIMAYGDGDLTLENFDTKTEPEVFHEVTGITLEDFLFLRDGGDRVNPETGETEHFEGHLFDEVVFNDSVEEFWRKKQELADYFDESHEEDIFDYIPPQRTNQIFTPRWVVVKMVDELERENPGCFDDPTKTFADLYMKSGLYITEIVKRLYRSAGLKAAFPNEGERIRHILRHQVFGMAPTRIIYLIARNFILGFDEDLKSEDRNFVQADAAEASKNGTLQELVDECFEN